MGQLKERGIIILVSEKDIFDYVFQPEKLSKEKINYIDQESSFSVKIEYYRQMKGVLQESEPDERLLKKIEERAGKDIKENKAE